MTTSQMIPKIGIEHTAINAFVETEIDPFDFIVLNVTYYSF